MPRSDALQNFRATGRFAPKDRAKKGKLSVDPSLDLTDADVSEGIDRFYRWHWGIEPGKVLDWNDTDIPAKKLIECGRLVQVHFRPPRPQVASQRVHARRERDTLIKFAKSVSNDSYLAFDPNHPYERLYLLVSSKALPELKQRLWTENQIQSMNLNQLAAIAGGHHGKRPDYPNLMVKPIGIMTAVVYFTDKKGDGPSYYIHQVGELSNVRPILAADNQGRLWLAGGRYTAPDPGITD